MASFSKPNSLEKKRDSVSIYIPEPTAPHQPPSAANLGVWPVSTVLVPLHYVNLWAERFLSSSNRVCSNGKHLRLSVIGQVSALMSPSF